MMGMKFGTKWELYKQPIDIQERQRVAFRIKLVMPAFEIMMYCFSLALGHLKFHHDQTYCQWIDANSNMSNVTMEYDPVTNTTRIYMSQLTEK